MIPKLIAVIVIYKNKSRLNKINFAYCTSHQIDFSHKFFYGLSRVCKLKAAILQSANRKGNKINIRNINRHCHYIFFSNIFILIHIYWQVIQHESLHANRDGKT